MPDRNVHPLVASSNVEMDRLRCVYLERLQRLADLRADALVTAAPDARRLVSFATYSTYQACADLGLRSIARKILGLPAQ